MLTSGPARELWEPERHRMAGRPTEKEVEKILSSSEMTNEEHTQTDKVCHAEKVQTVVAAAADTVRGEKEAAAGRLTGICVPS